MDFSKVFLILKREYLTKVKSKSFILSTLLTPLAFILMIAVIIFINLSDTEVEQQIAIVDHTEVLYERLIDLSQNRYIDASSIEVDTLRSQVLSGALGGYIILEDEVITEGDSPTLVYGGSGGMSFLSSIRSDLRTAVQEEQLSRQNVSQEIRNIFESRIGLESVKLTETGEEEDNTVIASVVGFILGLFIFMGIFIYGSVLMRSVLEEKTSRIVEVIASSVKPIELMFGKLLGILGMALTQFGIWIGIYIGISLAAAPIASMIMDAQMQNIPEDAIEATSSFDPNTLNQMILDPSIFVYFFLFFLIGFLIYSAVFAAIGAAVENEQDSQQFMLPVSVPIFIAYFLNTRVMEAPDSPLSVFISMFPLTAPINMMSRIAATEVPFWEIAVSLLLMILTFLGIMWLAAKIYRVGILMYGKKPGFKELIKWVQHS